MPDYLEMTPLEADSFMTTFLEEMPASRQRLAETLDQQGADAGLASELTPASLHPIWSALTPLLAWQELYVAPDPMTRPVALAPLEGLGDLSELSSWFAVGHGHGLERYSPRTLWLIDGIARHLGNVLVEHDGWAWTVGHGPRRGDSYFIYENQPVVLSSDKVRSSLMSTAVLVGRELDGRSLSGAPLKDVYDTWLAPPPAF